MTEICTVFQFIDFCCIKLSHQGRPPQLCISQFHLRAAPAPGYCGEFALLVSPGGICNFSHCPGAGHLPTPGQFPSFETNAVSYQNRTTQRVLLEKKQISPSVKDRGVVKACSRFYAWISSLFIKPLLHSETRELSTWINVFWLVNQISLDIIWKTSFHIYNLFITYNFTELY